MQEITHVVALWDIIDFNQFTVGSIYYAGLGQVGGWGFGYGGSNVPNSTGQMHGREQRHTNNTNASMHTNNVMLNNPDLGSPGGEHTQYLDNTKLGGGLNRWHLLTTKNTWASQTGLQAGVLQAQYNNYETFSYDAVTGQVENFGCDDPDSQWPSMGQYEYMIPESQGFANFNVAENDLAYLFLDMKLPDVGADDILDDGFRAYMKFNFQLGLDLEMMNSNMEAGMDFSQMWLGYIFLATSGETSENTDNWGNNDDNDYSQAATARMNTTAAYWKTLAEADPNSQGKLQFDNITDNPEFPLPFAASEDNDDNSTIYSEFSNVGHGGTTLYIGEARNPWYNPGQYNNVTFAMHYRNGWGDVPSIVPIGFNLNFNQMYLEYTGIFSKFTDSPFYINNYKGRHFVNNTGVGYLLIENPSHVIQDILKHELFYDGNFNTDECTNAYNATQNWNLGFSVTEKTNAKKLIEDLCVATPIYPRFRSRSEFGFITMKDFYLNDDVNKEIKSKDVIKFQFTRSKIEKIASSVEVKFDFDYETEEYRQTTGWFSCKDYLGDGDLGYEDENGNGGYSLGYYNLGEIRTISTGISIKQDTDTARTLEAKYITDIAAARKYARFYTMYNCNQHIKIKLELTLAYLDLEVGDVCSFDKLIGNTSAYGLDYTKTNTVNGQKVYPYFMIESITKKLDKIEITLIQLHMLLKTFTPRKGDISRRGSDVEDPESQPDDLDKYMLIEYLENKQTTRYTSDQMKSMDINYSNSVTFKDLAFWDEWIEVGEDIGEDPNPPEPPGPDPDEPGAIE